MMRTTGAPATSRVSAMRVPHIRLVLVLAAVALVAFSIPQIRRPISRFLSFSGPNARDHADNRLPQINAALDATRPGFVFLAGDSHAELLGDGDFCGLPVVNGGSHGASTQLYTWLLGNFTFKAQPSKAILIIGTNDIFAKSRPMEPRNLAEKIGRIEAIAKTLAKISPQLTMTTLPPIPAETARILDPVALKAFSQEQKRLCEQLPACQFVDPYEDLRETDNFSLARPDATSDGLHIADYGHVRRNLEEAMCPAAVVTSRP